MKVMKYFVILMLISCLFQFTFGEKRAKPLPMKELTDPSSPSYVPIPYPKNRKEIIVDLKYALNKLFGDKDGTHFYGKVPKIREILVQLAESNSPFKIGEIIKVKNRAHGMPNDYTWLILIIDKNGEIAARISMRATGLFGGARPTGKAAKYFKTKYPNSRIGPHILKTDDDVIVHLSEALGRHVEKNEIKKMERVAFQSTLGDLYVPMFEIEMSNGKIYYYSTKRDTTYELEKRNHWKKDNNGNRCSPWSLVPSDRDYLPDSVNEEILQLRKLDKNNKKDK